MRRIKRWLSVVATIAATGFMVWLVSLPLRAMRDPVDPDGAGLPAHRGYWLADNRTLKFNLESGRLKVRLLANAALDGLNAIEDRYGYYSIAYRVLDAEDRELANTEYFMRLHSTQYDGQLKWSFDDRAYLPTDTNLFYLDLAALSNAVRLELTVGQSSAPIRGISVRPYHQELRREDRLERYWQRLHESKRARAAQANSFEAEFLTERERQNLVRRRWRPLVPIGVEDDDYEIVMLRDESVDRLRDETTHAGTSDTTERWFLKAGRATTIGLPRAVRLLVIAQTSGPSSLEPGDLSLMWSGRLKHERAKLTLTPNGTGLQTVADIDAGVVEFLAHRDMWLQTADLAERRSLAPTITPVRGYAVDQTVLRIPVNHAGASATPIRLDFRTERAAKFQANVDFVGRDNRVARTRTLTATSTSSDRDWLRYRGSRVPVAAPSTSYLNVGPEIAELHITSRQRIWLSAYNRPPSLTRYRQIPESLFGGTEDTHRYPSWFVLVPTGATQLIDEGSSRVVESAVNPIWAF